MNKPIVQSLWVGETLSLLEQLCIRSFISNGHHFHLYVYQEPANIPSGTIIKDANEIIPEQHIFTYKRGFFTRNKDSYAGFADWFRWALLSRKGNFWVDMDVINLKTFDFDTDLIFGLESDNFVCSAVLGFPANHELCRLLESVCEQPNKILAYDSGYRRLKKTLRKKFNNSRSNISWGEAGGPAGLTRALKHFHLFEKAKPSPYFYPVHYSSWYTIFDETGSKNNSLSSESYAIHLWNEMGRKKGIDKNAAFPEDSLIEQLKRTYL